MVKNLPTNAGDARDVGSFLGSGSSLKEEMAPHSSIIAWKIPWTEDPDSLHTVHGVTKSQTGHSD